MYLTVVQHLVSSSGVLVLWAWPVLRWTRRVVITFSVLALLVGSGVTVRATLLAGPVPAVTVKDTAAGCEFVASGDYLVGEHMVPGSTLLCWDAQGQLELADPRARH